MHHGFWPVEVAEDGLENQAQLLRALMKRGYAFQLMGRNGYAPHGLDVVTLRECYANKKRVFGAPLRLLCMLCLDGPEQWPWHNQHNDKTWQHKAN